MQSNTIHNDEPLAELRQFARAEPFVPFEIARRSGPRHLVTTSDHIAMNGNTVVVIAPGMGIIQFRAGDVAGVEPKSAASK